jgi:hypothetical protein
MNWWAIAGAALFGVLVAQYSKGGRNLYFIDGYHQSERPRMTYPQLSESVRHGRTAAWF